MPEIELQRFRKLRQRAGTLLQNLTSDLTPFRHDLPDHGFLRTPDSRSLAGDVNVTTTCSCLMALALTGELPSFYGKEASGKVDAIFTNILTAPWMSSGLAENNAFTTTLVLRTAGYLIANDALKRGRVLNLKKRWEPQFSIADFDAFTRKLTKAKPGSVSALLFALMPLQQQRDLIELPSQSREKTSKTRQQTENEVARIVHALLRFTMSSGSSGSSSEARRWRHFSGRLVLTRRHRQIVCCLMTLTTKSPRCGSTRCRQSRERSAKIHGSLESTTTIRRLLLSIGSSTAWQRLGLRYPRTTGSLSASGRASSSTGSDRWWSRNTPR